MKERIFKGLCWLLLLSGTAAKAQDPMHAITLRQSVEAALNNNLQVKQSELLMQTAEVNARQAKENRLPDLFANVNHGLSQGRSIDPFTNSYINQQITYGTYSLNSTVVLFNGFQLKNLVKQNEMDYQANRMDLQQTKDNVMLNVLLTYLQILNNQEQLQQARNQAEVSAKQVERLTVMNDAGAISPALLYDLKGQLANDQLAIVNNQNALNASRLSLAQLMNVAYDPQLQAQQITADTLNLDYQNNPAGLYDISVKQLSLVKAAEYRLQSAQSSVKVARGYHYPTVGLGGSFNTNYSNAATRDNLVNTEEIASDDYVNVSGTKVPVMTRKLNFVSQKIPYGDQFNNNYNTSVYLSVSIPILNRFKAKNQVALAKIALRNATLSEQTIKTQLSQNIEQAYFNMTAAREKYTTLQQQVADFTESFRTAEVRFEAGAITQVDYLVAKNNVDRSRANLISTKYDYIFRLKILDYYRNQLSLD